MFILSLGLFTAQHCDNIFGGYLALPDGHVSKTWTRQRDNVACSENAVESDDLHHLIDMYKSFAVRKWARGFTDLLAQKGRHQHRQIVVDPSAVARKDRAHIDTGYRKL